MSFFNDFLFSLVDLESLFSSASILSSNKVIDSGLNLWRIGDGASKI